MADNVITVQSVMFSEFGCNLYLVGVVLHKQ